MQIAMIGLGRMGANMATRLSRGGHDVVAYDRSPDAAARAATAGAASASSLDDLVKRLQAPRVVWVMVPAGEPTETTIASLGERLTRGDTVIDGGNSNYKDSMRRAAALAQHDVNLIDVGTSGGIWGLTEGYSLMIRSE